MLITALIRVLVDKMGSSQVLPLRMHPSMAEQLILGGANAELELPQQLVPDHDGYRIDDSRDNIPVQDTRCITSKDISNIMLHNGVSDKEPILTTRQLKLSLLEIEQKNGEQRSSGGCSGSSDPGAVHRPRHTPGPLHTAISPPVVPHVLDKLSW